MFAFPQTTPTACRCWLPAAVAQKYWCHSILVRLGLLAIILVGITLPASAAMPRPETLHYKVEAPLFKNAGQATIALRQIGPDLYEGEIRGETSGAVALFSGHRRDRYRTTMRFSQGKLQPVLYVEESWVGKKHHYKEYRFDYDQRRLEMWRLEQNGDLVRKWEHELTAPLYDPISAFYNFRGGGFGELRGGETLSIAGIPYPQPETITVHLGLQEPGDRRATVTIRQRAFENETGLVHLRFDDDWVPLAAWTRVLVFGKLSGRLIGRY
ncbi:MAG: DUF3108 domain-containing protein [Desulfobacca sp.]